MKKNHKIAAIILATLNSFQFSANAESNIKIQDLNKSDSKLSETTDLNVDTYLPKKRKPRKNNNKFIGLFDNLFFNRNAVNPWAIFLKNLGLPLSLFIGYKLLKGVSWVFCKTFESTARYYLKRPNIKASDWHKVDDIIMNAVFDVLVNGEKSDIYKQVTSCENLIKSNKEFSKVQNPTIKDYQKHGSDVVKVFRKFVLLKFTRKVENQINDFKDSQNQNQAIETSNIYGHIFDGKSIREVLKKLKNDENYKITTSSIEKKHNDVTHEENLNRLKQVVRFMLVAFVDDSNITSQNYNNFLTNTILVSILFGQNSNV